MLLRSLMLQWNSSNLRDKMLLHAYVVDTDLPSPLPWARSDSRQQRQWKFWQRRDQLHDVINKVNSDMLSCSRVFLDPTSSSQVMLFQNKASEQRQTKNFMFGYDESEHLLQYLMKQVVVFIYLLEMRCS